MAQLVQGLDIYKVIFDAISEGLILVDQSGKIHLSNQRASEMFGYDSEEFKKKYVEDLIPASLKSQHKNHRKEYHKSPRQRTMGLGLKLEGKRKDDTTFPLEISLNHFSKEGETYVVALITDVTVEKKKEEEIKKLNEELEELVEERTNELKESQRLYQVIARNFPDGTINVFDRDLNYVFVEGRALYAMGITSKNLIGTSYLDRIEPGVAPELEQTLKDVFKGENKTFEVRYNDFYYELNAVPLINEKGVIEQILVVEHNVTQQKLAEENALKSLEKERQLNELKSRFVSMASHEFRTPLSTILSSSSLAHKYLNRKENGKEKAITHLKKIQNSVHNLNSILNDFLSLEKLDSGVVQMKSQQFNLLELIHEVKEDLSDLSKNNQKLEIICNTGDTSLYSDPNSVKNVMINLLSNAIKYSPENSTIKVTIDALDRGFRFSVKDEGIGIPEKEQEMLFTRFFRAKNAINIQGTGLGLHIVKRYVDKLNGTISVESKDNEGSEFTVYLPQLKKTN